jgi:hypothetical protein
MDNPQVIRKIKVKVLKALFINNLKIVVEAQGLLPKLK